MTFMFLRDSCGKSVKIPDMLLTAAIAEDVQRARNAGADVLPTISSLSDATLPGLMEYACLCSSNAGYPALPSHLMSASFWGREFAAPRRRSSSRDTQSRHAQAARFDISDANVLQSQQWETFQFYFVQASKAAGLNSGVADALAAAMHEMAENAMIHSESLNTIAVGYRAVNGESTFCVTDLGIGVLASLKSNSEYSTLNRHSDAIRLALRDGVSRFSDGGGFGFRSIFKALVSNWGSLRFRSGEGCIQMDGLDLDSDHGQVSFPPALPGLQASVTARCQTVIGQNLCK